jgi:hypothetical protein
MTVTENRLPVERAAGCAVTGTDGPSPAGNWSSMFADHFKQHTSRSGYGVVVTGGGGVVVTGGGVVVTGGGGVVVTGGGVEVTCAGL